ncbi:MAG: hypothetical protein QOG82_871 [Actinomycetota bacterium]|nr:hypothetical protein [Actinomycetota bacterium]
MSRGSNVGRTVFGVAAAAGVAGLLNYTPPPTEVRAAAPVPSLPVVAGPFTATPASIPLPVEVTTPTTTLPPPAPTTTAAPSVTQAPPPPVPEPAPPEPPEVVWGPAPAPVARYAPAPVYYPPEPEPEAAPADDSDDKCAHFDELLSALNDSDLRAAVATVGCG